MEAQVGISFGAIDAVMACLRLLAAMPDLGRDETFIRSISSRVEMSAGAALACRKLLERHRDRLPRGVVAVAMGEVEPPATEPASYEALDEMLETLGLPRVPEPKRGRGRPRKAGGPLSQAERTRRWREGKDIVSLEIPSAVAERLRQLRVARGVTTAELLLAALGTLEEAEGGGAVTCSAGQ